MTMTVTISSAAITSCGASTLPGRTTRSLNGDDIVGGNWDCIVWGNDDNIVWGQIAIVPGVLTGGALR